MDPAKLLFPCLLNKLLPPPLEPLNRLLPPPPLKRLFPPPLLLKGEEELLKGLPVPPRLLLNGLPVLEVELEYP